MSVELQVPILGSVEIGEYFVSIREDVFFLLLKHLIETQHMVTFGQKTAIFNL